MKSFPCIESTVDVYYSNFRVRLWINQEELLTSYPDSRLAAEALNDYINTRRDQLARQGKRLSDLNYKELTEFIQDNIPRVNAAQFSEKVGPIENGVVVYFVDFGEKDPHG